MYEIDAIPTYYKDYLFRSRLEVQWAMFLDAFSIDWKYEYKVFSTNNAKWYLPDFYIPESEVWIEIKPQVPSESELRKISCVANTSNQLAILIAGFPVLNYGSINGPSIMSTTIYLFLPNEKHRLEFLVEDLFRLLEGDYAIKSSIIKLVYLIVSKNHQSFNMRLISEIITTCFVNLSIENNGFSQYSWHHHLNKSDLKLNSSQSLDISESIKKELLGFKKVILGGLDKKEIEQRLSSIYKSRN